MTGATVQQQKVQRGFSIAVLIALLLHVIAAWWVLVDKEKPKEILFKKLRVTIGAAEGTNENTESPDVSLEQLAAQGNNVVSAADVRRAQREAAVAKLAGNVSASAEGGATGATTVTSVQAGAVSAANAGAEAHSAEAEAAGVPLLKGVPLGNSFEEEQTVPRSYEAVLSLWLNRHKTYPYSARVLGMEGEGMVSLAVRNDGTVLNFSVSKSTGHELLDRALIDMVMASSPVPAFPKGYTNKTVMYFQVPIVFSLGDKQ